MNVLSVENLAKSVRDVPLFRSVSFGLDKGNHVGVVGRNGAGKSTFFRVLCGEETPDEGTISVGREEEIALLPQTITFDRDDTIDSYFWKGPGKRIAAKDPGALILYHSLLGELSLFKTDMPMSQLSGGEVKKAAIARLFASGATLLLLDEPTNHLDIPTIEWLEKRVRGSKLTILTVTHDRYFLDATSSAILEIDGGSAYLHPGSFASYLERKEERLEDERKEQARLKSILRRELDWLGHGAKARTTKQQGRIQRIRDMQEEVRRVGEPEQRKFQSRDRRLGRKILRLAGLVKAYDGRTLFTDFTYNFLPGDRIGLIGPNGSGKSTLLDIIAGRIPPDSGSVDAGVNTVFAYYDQRSRNLPEDKTITEYVSGIAERIRLSPGEVVSPARFLELFGFPPPMQRQAISSLSGGEKRRLYLVSTLLSNPNFLLLDEPTNDLDLETMENLEQYIRDFSGCALIVSHDRAFLDQTCGHLFVLGWNEDKTVFSFPGSHSDWELYAESLPKKEAEKGSGKKKAVRKNGHEKKKGLTFREKREYEALEGEMKKLQEDIARLEASFATAGATTDGTLAQRTALYNAKREELAAKEDRWLELAERAEEE